ncbi:GTPase-associated system all-helical protein GASH [Rhizobium sp. PL01]|uniref:GTPase-associated system all-helical protein GASH n=1 Tax=Rhizobium sp. PL01 TaxID=3085631 RepID=UPI0029815AC6|nr:GTPase-associated system all-helical protein GASH [Rhizobium sp. PL01]MDW5312993.1 GTPase-associated system all-helical protein GASH [Rhizobium sp. PL01]
MKFDFVQQYRSLQPLADQAKIEASHKSFEELKESVEETEARDADLVRLAFGLPHEDPSESDEWFSKSMRNHNPMFSLEHDREEAANIATLVLKARIASDVQTTCIFVLAASFIGRRSTVDKGALIEWAKDGLAQAVRRNGKVTAVPRVSSHKIPDLTKAIGAFDENAEGAAAALVDSQSTAYVSRINKVVAETNALVGTLVSVNSRLATEVNMLWWHIGNHSLLADRPLDEIPLNARAFVVAADVATISGTPPGPYGAYGIIRKTLGADADKKVTLSDAVNALQDVKLASLVGKKVDEDKAIIPIHVAARALLVDGSPMTTLQLEKATGIALDTSMSVYELALQVFHERLLVNSELLI